MFLYKLSILSYFNSICLKIHLHFFSPKPNYKLKCSITFACHLLLTSLVFSRQIILASIHMNIKLLLRNLF